MYSWLVGHTYWTVVAGGGTTFCTASKASTTLGESTAVFCEATQNKASSGGKDLVDTIKLVAYRAETAMAQVVREALPQWRQDEERRLLQSLYGSEADLIPNEAAGTLTVRLH